VQSPIIRRDSADVGKPRWRRHDPITTHPSDKKHGGERKGIFNHAGVHRFPAGRQGAAGAPFSFALALGTQDFRQSLRRRQAELVSQAETARRRALGYL
jgi:hypothetical protein